jgi:hypothetical protein
MKQLSKLFGISLALCGLVCFSSCNKDEEVETLAAPTILTASSVTDNSAVLSWTSDAPSFEIKVGSGTYTSSASSYNLEDLSPSTTYSWSVKAVKGAISSEWAEGPAFSTVAPIPSATVTFGTQVWSAKATRAIVDFEDPYMQVQLYSTENSSLESMDDAEYPIFQFFVAGNTVNNYSDANGFTPSWDYDVDYYHQTYIDLGDEEEPWYVGDYWMDTDFPSSIDITAIDASTVSGTVNLTLMDIITFINSGYETVINVPLSVAFVNLPVTDYASLSVPFAASKNSVQSNPVLKPGKYPIKFNKNKEEKIKALKATK